MRPFRLFAAPGPGRVRATRSSVLLALVAGTIAALSVWFALIAFVIHERYQSIDEAHEHNALLTRVFADSVARDIDSANLANSALGNQLLRGLPPDGPELHAVLAQTLVNLPFLRGLAVVDAQGLVISSTETDIGHQVIDMTVLGTLPAAGQDRLGTFVRARHLLDLVSSGAPRSAPFGAGFLPLVRTVQLRNGQRLHLIAMLDGEAFTRAQQVTMTDWETAAVLASFDGQLIASTAGVMRATGSSLADLAPFQDATRRHEQGHWQGRGLRDGEQLGSFRALPNLPLVALVETSADDTLAEWGHKVLGSLLIGMVATTFIAGVTWVVARSLQARMAARLAIDRAQVAVVQREQELSVTLKSLQELIFRTDANGTITFVNQHWMPVTGTHVASALGQRPWEMVLASDRDRLWSLFTTRPGPEARRAQASLIDATGAVRTFDFAVMPLQQDGVTTGFACSAIDVTQRVEAERRLQSQLEFTKLVMDISPLPMSVIDLDGCYVLVNQAWTAFTGQHGSDWAFMPAADNRHPTAQRLHDPADQALLLASRSVRRETSVVHQDGRLRDVVVNKVLLCGLDGRPSGILCVFMDVSEFRHAERATQEARDAAEEASRAKSEFIANISHELRTPLQSILGFSELGQARARTDDRLRAMFDDVHGAGMRMLSLVNDLLDVSKLDSTVGTIHLESNDLRSLVREVVREIDPLIASRQLHIELNLPAHPMVARVDPPRFQQVVRNVLANAIKFSPQRSRIDIVGDRTPSGGLRLVIRDQGPGVPVAELEKIFEAFVQSSQTQDGSGGSGLGLAICRKIMDAHGGRIHAENLPGRGAAFHIVVPERSIARTGDDEVSDEETTATCWLDT